MGKNTPCAGSGFKILSARISGAKTDNVSFKCICVKIDIVLNVDVNIAWDAARDSIKLLCPALWLACSQTAMLILFITNASQFEVSLSGEHLCHRNGRNDYVLCTKLHIAVRFTFCWIRFKLFVRHSPGGDKKKLTHHLIASYNFLM